MSLNPAQRAAVEHAGSPLIVLAGPGTGKTRVITARVAHLIERGAEPERVLALTFTNKAAGELRERLAALLGMGVAERVQAGTFHALGLRLLRRFGDRAGLGARVQIMDSSQQRRLMRELALAHNVYGRSPAGVAGDLERARSVIAMLRNAGITPERARAWAERRLAGELDEGERVEVGVFARDAELFALFDAGARERGLVTFDDLLARPTELLGRDPLAAAMVRADVRHVVVDEFQDVNTAQIDLLRALAPPDSSPDLVVVGDDDQSIYAFRGADDRAFDRFERTWQNVRTIALSETYRSPEEVVRVAAGVIARAGVRFAPGKTIEVAPGRAGPPGSVEVVPLGSYDESGEVIAALVRHDAGERAGGGEPDWTRYAVIARKKRELGRVRQALELAGVPVSAPEDAGAPEDQGVQDLAAWVGLLLDPEASWEAQRLLTRPPISADGAVVIEWLRAYRAARSRGAPGAFAPWLAAHAEGGPEAAAARRFAELAAELAGVAAKSRADEAMGEIVRRTGLVHADLLSGRERAARVRAVASVLRFVHDRVDRLDQPRDLAAWRRYYDDLDEKEQAYVGQLGEDAIGEGEPGADAERPNAVTLLTAHAAKGLEFDTVFVSGVSPAAATAFPDVRAQDVSLPEGVIDRVGDDRAEKDRARDEERRLFYVACTRAQRRLVLLGTVPKSGRSSSTHFLCELKGAEGVSWRASDEVLRELAGDAPAFDEAQRAVEAVAARERAAAALDRARREARLEAAAALARAGASPDEPGEAIEALARAARRMAVICGAERSGGAPPWAPGAGLGDFGERLAAVVREGLPEGDDHAGTEPLAPPLRMSYTGIAAYEWCPRCFYMEHAVRLPSAPAPAQRFGRGMHEGLQAFYERWREADSAGEPLPGEAELVETVRRFVGASFPDRDEIEPGTLEQAEAQARVVWERMHDPSVNISELETRVRLPFEIDGVEHLIEASLDRVDQLPGGDWRIVDYKTGRSRAKLTDPKKLVNDLQMGIYTLALRHHYQDASIEGVCEYWFLGDGVRSSIGFDELDLDDVRATIERAARGMLAGEFPRSDACRRRGGASACTRLGEV